MESPAETVHGRRRRETLLGVAQVAADSFAERGTSGTTAEDIATAAGISSRTFFRYFRTKEESVAPLLGVGGQRWRELLVANAAEATLPDAVEAAMADLLSPSDPERIAELRRAGRLVAVAADDPALRSVWYRVNCDSEAELAPMLAGLGLDRERARLMAASATHAVRLAFELWAADGAGDPADLGDRAVRYFRGLGGRV